MEDHIWNKRHELLYRCEMSIKYHRRRERFFDLMDRFVKIVTIIGSSAVFFRLAEAQVLLMASLVMLIGSTVSLVLQFSSRATVHAGMAKDWGALQRDVIAGDELTDTLVAGFDARAVTLDSLEPCTLRSLVTDIQNEMARAAGDESKIRPLGFWRLLGMHFFDIAAPAPK